MNDALFYATGLLCFLSLTTFGSLYVDAIPYKCKEGVECLPLDKCTGLYRRWQGDRETYNHTVETLLCEKFEAAPNKLPKVCCAAQLFLTSEALAEMKPVARTVKFSNEGRSSVQPACGVQDADRIFGGELTQIDEYPWMALLKYNSNILNMTGNYCGGVLISSRYILTAAHCVRSWPAWNLTHAILGEWNTTSGRDCSEGLCNEAIEVPIETAVVHDHYDVNDPNMMNDIALLRLDRDVKYTTFVRHICLPTEPALLNNDFDGYDLQVAGWGKTKDASASAVKLKVSLPVFEHKKCHDHYDRHGRNITVKQLCVGGQRGKDSCKGDSGGPLMGQVSSENRWTVVGVVSYGPHPCGTEGWPGIYTRVTPYLKWIQDNMNQ